MDCQYEECMYYGPARKEPSDAYPRVPGCWRIPLSYTRLIQGNLRCWSLWSFLGGSLWNQCRGLGSCMLLASGWSESVGISFAPDLDGKDPSWGRPRFGGHCTWRGFSWILRGADLRYSMTLPWSMQCLTRTSCHSKLRNSFHSGRKVCKCHFERSRDADNQRRRLDGMKSASLRFCWGRRP